MKTATEFWAAVDRSGGPSACWPWMLSKSELRGGYGQVNWHGRIKRAHRVAYELTFGPISDGLTLDHICHVPDLCSEPCMHTSCVNPARLEAVSLQDNLARRAYRWTCGRGHPKTAEHGRIRSGNKWRCVTCETEMQRARRARRAA